MIQVYEIMAFVAAVTVSFAMMFTKRAYTEGGKQNHILVATTVFQPFIYIIMIALSGDLVVNWGQFHWLLIYSALLVIGMLFGFKSISMGDASIISPIMGSRGVISVIAVAIFAKTLKLKESKKSKLTLVFRLIGSICILIATALVLGE